MIALNRIAAVPLLILAAVPAGGAAQAGAPIGDAPFDSAFYAWERGEYPDALTRLNRLLAGESAERYVEPAAVLTGEPFHTVELDADGRGLVWSPDSRYVAWETGAATPTTERRVRVARLETGRAVLVADVAGHSPVFDGGRRVVYVTQGAQESGGAGLVARDLASGRETRIATPGIVPQGALFRTGDTTLHVVASPADARDATEVWLPAASPRRLTTQPGAKSDLALLADGVLVYRTGRTSFAVQDRTGTVRAFEGGQLARSADGSTLAFVRQERGENALTLLRPASGGAPRDIVRTTRPLAAPSLSADGSRILFQMMPREDWELYVVSAAGGEPERITREIQHDVLPRFAGSDRVIALVGEPRHRRSYLYDLSAGTRTRLFHNNTVRTVAPEYEWALSPDGSKLAIVADRDGDTVSPERGVYLMDLTRRVALPELRARVQAQLAAETALRERGRELFAGLEPAVRAAVADVSKDRIYRYQQDLFRFDSKHITRPGNARAIEYIAARLREFGYEPRLEWFEARGVRTANVVAEVRGTVRPDAIYVVSSHFDSVIDSPGADDNTSGTAALLEAARVLATRPQEATLRFAFLTAEESGLLGAREHVRLSLERGDRIEAVINNDMIGFANDQRLDNTIRYTNPYVRDVIHAAAFLFTDLITYDARYFRSTDAHAFFDGYGDIIGGIGSYPILGNPHYHQSHDHLETINHQLVTEVSRTTVAALLRLANGCVMGGGGGR